MQTASVGCTNRADKPVDRGVAEDLTGRERLVSNILFSWGAHFVFIAAGFIIPRMIDRRLGPDVLGVWDFGWSLVVYTEFLAVGISSSVNKYVSHLKSLQNWEELNAIVSSAFVLLVVGFCLGLLLTAGLAHLTPYCLQVDDETLLSEAKLIVLILGTVYAVQLPMLAFTGVITGCGRFDIESTIRGGSRVLEVVTMIVVLVVGGGVVHLASVVLGFQCTRVLGSVVAAKYVCPQLRLSLCRCSSVAVAQVLAFGGKTLLYTISRTGMYHINAILIAHFLGPAMLAVFSRQRALVLHCEDILINYARTLVPVASAVHARNDKEGTRELLIKGSLYSLYIALPAVMVLAIMGRPLVRLWMGPNYDSSLVLGVLAVGHLALLSQRGTGSVIMGLNRHGLIAAAMFASLAISILLGWFLLRYTGMGLMGAALALALPATLIVGLGTMWAGCHIAEVSVKEYLQKTLPGPVKLMIPFVAWLLLARWACGKNTSLALITGLLPACVMLFMMYWYVALSASIKHQITSSIVGLINKAVPFHVKGESHARNSS